MSSRDEQESWQEALRLVQQGQDLIRRREFDEAERLLLRGLALLRNLVGDEDLHYSIGLNNLGMLYHVRGKDDLAEPLLLQVVDVRRRACGEQHPMYWRSLRDLADFYRSCNNPHQAALWQRQADEVEKKIPGTPPPS
jgi:hypothetical protein